MNIKKRYIFFLVYFFLFIMFPKLSSALPKLTIADIINNAVYTRRLVIVGENISSRKASEIAAEEYAYGWYSLSKGFLSKIHQFSLFEPIEDTPGIKRLIEYLNAIKESGIHWDIILTRRGKKAFYKTLKKMNSKDLDGSDVLIILSYKVRKSKKLFFQIKRVYGDNVKIISRDE